MSQQVLSALRGERLLWAGRPDTRVLFGRADGYLIPVSIVWCAFIVFWNITAGPDSLIWPRGDGSMWLHLGRSGSSVVTV